MYPGFKVWGSTITLWVEVRHVIGQGKTIVILVNNEIDNDPRVSRTVSGLKDYFSKIVILSGVPTLRQVHKSQRDNILVRRYFFYKPNFGGSASMKRLLGVAMKNSSDATSANHKSGFLRNALFLGWLGYILIMNLIIFVRFLFMKGDVYYSNDFDTLLSGFLLSRIHKKKFVYDAHEMYAELIGNSPKFYKNGISFFERKLSAGADAIITVNNPISQILQSRYRLQNRPHVIYNTPYKTGVSQASPLRPQTPIKLLYHGMFLPGRDLDKLILAMKYLNGFQLYFRGFGVLDEYLRELTHDNKLDEKVVFLKPVPMLDMVAAATEFDMGIIPYPGSPQELNSYYCTPNKIFEYMMAGLAVGATNLPVLQEIIIGNDIGIVFDTSKPEQIADALGKLSVDEIYRMKGNSLQASLKKYNYEEESKKLVKIFEDLD